MTVRRLERRAGGQRRPAHLRATHQRPVCACDACPESGLVLTSSEDCNLVLWRSAAAMAACGDDAELARFALPFDDGPCSSAWLLPPRHLARLRAGPLYRLRGPQAADERAALLGDDAAGAAHALDDEFPHAEAGASRESEASLAAGLAASRAWRGPSALLLTVLRPLDAEPQCATATLWEVPLPAEPPFGADWRAADDVAPPPPSRVAMWHDIFAGPTPPQDAEEAEEDDRVGSIGATLCKSSASIAVLTPDGGVALRDLCTGEELRPEALRFARAAELRNCVCDEHASNGSRHMLLESRAQLMTLIDVEGDAQLSHFALPRQQLPLMFSERAAAWLPQASRVLITGQCVALDPLGGARDDAMRLRRATRDDGAGVSCDRNAEVAAAAAARAAPWFAHADPAVVLYRLWDCAAGAAVARVALPALRSEAEGGALSWNGNVVTLDAFTPGEDVFTALLVSPQPAGGRGRVAGALHLWRSSGGGATVKLPDTATLRPRHDEALPHPAPGEMGGGMPAAFQAMFPGVAHDPQWAHLVAALGQATLPPALPPFQFGFTEAVSWRWAVVAEYAAAGEDALHLPGSLFVLDMLGGGGRAGG